MNTTFNLSPDDNIATERQIVAQQIDDALIMLDFARRKAISLPDNMITELVGRKYETTTDLNYAKFLDALGKLTKLITPATPESIKFAREVNARGVSRVRALVGRYATIGYLLFLLLFLCQGYWFLLNSLVDNVNTTALALAPYGEVEDIVSAQIEARKQGAPATPQETEAAMRAIYDRAGEQVLIQQGVIEKKLQPSGSTASDAKAEEKLLSRNERNFLEITLASDFAGLNSFVGWLTPFLRSRCLEAQIGEKKYLYLMGLPELKSMQAAHMLLDMLNRYVLPIIYGFLGGAIYLVRRLTIEIKEVSFTESMRPELVTRFFLGGVSGLVVAWFVAPESSKTDALLHNTSVLSTLSPLAVSFIAGYAIELVFSVIDRIVSAFTEKESKARG